MTLKCCFEEWDADQVTRVGATGKSRKLSREIVVRTAIEMADQDGLEAVTLRKLAAVLGVTPMALYKHLDSKDELEQLIAHGMLQRSVTHIPAGEDKNWRELLWAVAINLKAMLLEHRSILKGYIGKPFFLSKTNLLIQEQFHDALTRAGIPADEHRTIARIVGNFIIGSVFISLNAGAHPADSLGTAILDDEEFDAVPRESIPHLVVALEASAGQSPVDFEVCFSMILELVGSRACRR